MAQVAGNVINGDVVLVILVQMVEVKVAEDVIQHHIHVMQVIEEMAQHAIIMTVHKVEHYKVQHA